jgi:hypothetical protein
VDGVRKLVVVALAIDQFDQGSDVYIWPW